MACYPKTPYTIGQGSMVLSCNRAAPHPVALKPDLPGAVIVVHGVNDVGTSYGAVEEGLCKGLSKRLGYEKPPFKPGTYRNYNPEKDAKRLLEDPDAVFYKRQFDENTHSPVIPFYWGFRERDGAYKSGARAPHGQATDRYGNRLDKDFSKGGGPFANATTNLVDMWNSGAAKVFGVTDSIAHDPLRPVLKGPGRLYMVLAAQRLAALISMIRDYDPKETVSIVAHSQGCLVSLLAQAFLMERPGCRPADTLILTHPPYSLEAPLAEGLAKWASSLSFWNSFGGGTDAQMESHYGSIAGRQNLRARLDTLINIVKGVHQHKAQWSADELKHMRENGVHGAKWEPAKDRDNRGKVYLYFCPEDMTVALPNVKGIGWQGIPDTAVGEMLVPNPDRKGELKGQEYARQARKELGEGMLQRVFTARLRPNDKTGKPEPFLVGLAPQDYTLIKDGENEYDHVTANAASHRASLPEDNSQKKLRSFMFGDAYKRWGLRFISGEPLPEPCRPDMCAGALKTPKGADTAHESVDAIDAAIAVTSDYGLNTVWQLIDDPQHPIARTPERVGSPNAALHQGVVRPLHNREQQMSAIINAGKIDKLDMRQVIGVYACLQDKKFEYPLPTGKLLVASKESTNEARFRHQGGTSERSFHGAIIGSASNHERVTAYDVAVGQGLAVSHPKFYAYLCAVADWRLKQPKGKEKVRAGILTWQKFMDTHHAYWAAEPEWRRALIEGNAAYYSTGVLPKLPMVDSLPKAVISETMLGKRIERQSKGQA
jgi:pimeloyl-ACP methyl ester carboxylesterase